MSWLSLSSVSAILSNSSPSRSSTNLFPHHLAEDSASLLTTVDSDLHRIFPEFSPLRFNTHFLWGWVVCACKLRCKRGGAYEWCRGAFSSRYKCNAGRWEVSLLYVGLCIKLRFFFISCHWVTVWKHFYVTVSILWQYYFCTPKTQNFLGNKCSYVLKILSKGDFLWT